MRLDLTPYRNRNEFRSLKLSLSQAKAYFSERMLLENEHLFGVGSNTFRAFRGIKKPSLIFRQWASDFVQSQTFEREVLATQSRSRFELVHQKLNRALSNHWKAKCGHQISVSHRYKLVDLFVKNLCRLRLPDEKMNANLIKYGHVPIDSFVFTAVDRLFSGVFLTDGRSMGHIKTEKAYQFHQDLITKLMREMGAPALYFDYYAWNLAKGHSAQFRK